MTTDEAVLLAIVMFIIIAGLWLSGLTYLMWRSAQKAKEAEAAKTAEAAPPPPPAPEEVKKT